MVLTNYEAIETDVPAAVSTSDSETAAIMEPRRRPLAVKVEKPQRTFRPDGTYLITGGGGGFGSTLLRHAHYEHGATSFLITTRSDNHDKVWKKKKTSIADGGVNGCLQPPCVPPI